MFSARNPSKPERSSRLRVLSSRYMLATMPLSAPSKSIFGVPDRDSDTRPPPPPPPPPASAPRGGAGSRGESSGSGSTGVGTRPSASSCEPEPGREPGLEPCLLFAASGGGTGTRAAFASSDSSFGMERVDPTEGVGGRCWGCSSAKAPGSRPPAKAFDSMSRARRRNWALRGRSSRVGAAPPRPAECGAADDLNISAVIKPEMSERMASGLRQVRMMPPQTSRATSESAETEPCKTREAVTLDSDLSSGQEVAGRMPPQTSRATSVSAVAEPSWRISEALLSDMDLRLSAPAAAAVALTAATPAAKLLETMWLNSSKTSESTKEAAEF
mmetsp:Transcript_114825/g.364928  ORF Transcript_114825/g.364928 Transcript_114825/m.364928 type:complete len:329 (+) Transcript_114825:368-1354(+)